jgi:hypothetical protein
VRPISFATPTTTSKAAPRADKGSPSFLIAGASSKAAPSLRLDRINSSQVILAARRVLSQSLEQGTATVDPSGVVLSRLQGRLVFDSPVLLPEEQFVPIELIRGRQSRSGPARLRLPRKPSSA